MNQWNFCQIQNVKFPLHKCETPPLKTFLATVLAQTLSFEYFTFRHNVNIFPPFVSLDFHDMIVVTEGNIDDLQTFWLTRSC